MHVQQTQLKSFFKYDVWFVYLFKKKKNTLKKDLQISVFFFQRKTQVLIVIFQASFTVNI